MAEENIVVNRGIPMGGVPAGASGGSLYFGSGWNFINNLDSSAGFPGSLVSVSVDGATGSIRIRIEEALTAGGRDI